MDWDHHNDVTAELDADVRRERDEHREPPFADCCERPTVHWHVPPVAASRRRSRTAVRMVAVLVAGLAVGWSAHPHDLVPAGVSAAHACGPWYYDSSLHRPVTVDC